MDAEKIYCQTCSKEITTGECLFDGATGGYAHTNCMMSYKKQLQDLSRPIKVESDLMGPKVASKDMITKEEYMDAEKEFENAKARFEENKMAKGQGASRMSTVLLIPEGTISDEDKVRIEATGIIVIKTKRQYIDGRVVASVDVTVVKHSDL